MSGPGGSGLPPAPSTTVVRWAEWSAPALLAVIAGAVLVAWVRMDPVRGIPDGSLASLAVPAGILLGLGGLLPAGVRWQRGRRGPARVFDRWLVCCAAWLLIAGAVALIAMAAALIAAARTGAQTP
jgi:hypothetical protein